MRAYKGFAVASDGTISCRGHLYVEGETYVHDGPVEMCVAGYHACPMPLDTLRYYRPITSAYHEVKVGDDAQGDGDKVVAGRIKIGARLSIADLVKAHVDLVQDDRTPRDRSVAATDKRNSTAATSGDRSTAATSGDNSTAATSGYKSTAATSGDESIAVAGGYGCRARGALGCWLVLAERDDIGHILGVQAVPVDGDTIRAGALYVLRGGKVVEVES